MLPADGGIDFNANLEIGVPGALGRKGAAGILNSGQEIGVPYRDDGWEEGSGPTICHLFLAGAGCSSYNGRSACECSVGGRPATCSMKPVTIFEQDAPTTTALAWLILNFKF
jgi:hypothetical protein